VNAGRVSSELEAASASALEATAGDPSGLDSLDGWW